MNAVNSISFNDLVINEFRAGGINIFPAFFIKELLLIESDRSLVIAARLFYIFILGGITCYFIFEISKLLGFNNIFSYVSVLIFLLSPFSLSVSRIWYPDNYIYFFSSGFLLYLLKSKIFQSRNYFIYAGIFLGLTVSVKYTGIFLLIPVMILITTKKEVLFNLLILVVSSFVIFALVNYSIFINFDKFLLDFSYNLKNYGAHNWFDISGPIFYLVCSLAIFSTPIFAPIYFVGFYKSLKINDLKINLIFFIFPIFYIYYLGTANLVISRNVSLLIPFLIPVFTLGVYGISKYFKSYYPIIFLLLIPFVYYSIILFSYLEVDSRVMAQSWIEKNIYNKSTFDVNEFCSGDSPAHVSGFLTNYNTSFDSSADYVLINSYWGSPLSSMYWVRGALQYIDPSFLHFYNLNSRVLWRDYEVGMNLGYRYKNYVLIKIFDGSGPTLFLFKKESM
jgi:hypothetical protein